MLNTCFIEFDFHSLRKEIKEKNCYDKAKVHNENKGRPETV